MRTIRYRAAAAFLVGGVAAAGCAGDPVPCPTDDFCRIGQTHGKCISVNGARWCAAADAECASGERWQQSAGDGLANQCVTVAPPDLAVADAAAAPDLAVTVDAAPDLAPDLAAPDLATVDLGPCGAYYQPCCGASPYCSGGLVCLPVFDDAGVGHYACCQAP